jgi:Glyoxalase-like domain
MKLDHLAVSAETLADGIAWVQDALGVTLAQGGQHAIFATHNRLLGLGDLYLEVIATDPSQPAPDRPRWFGLDRFSGPARLTNWVVRSDDLAADLTDAPKGSGTPVALQRGQYHWQMAVPPDGVLPFDGACPALIQWQGPHHPSQALPDSSVRLVRLDIAHPQADALNAALAHRFRDDRVVIAEGPLAMQATFATPHGIRVLA